jgi:hypothetical protein
MEGFINDYTALFGIIFQKIKEIIILPKRGFKKCTASLPSRERLQLRCLATA